MPMILSARNAEVIMSVNGGPGHRFEGFSDAEDAIMMPQDIELATVVTGADGQDFAAGTGEIGGPVTLKFLPTSASVKWMMIQAEMIRKNDTVNTWQGTIVLPDHSIDHVLVNGTLLTTDLGLTLGKGSVRRPEWTWKYEEIELNYANAQLRPTA